MGAAGWGVWAETKAAALSSKSEIDWSTTLPYRDCGAGLLACLLRFSSGAPARPIRRYLRTVQLAVADCAGSLSDCAFTVMVLGAPVAYTGIG